MSKDPKYPPQVILALENRVDPLTTFIAYNLMTWLNDRRFGFGTDPEFNLLVNEAGKPIKIDSEENKIRRLWKVEWFLKSASQIGFNDVLSRRHREKSSMGLIGTLDNPIGDTGKTGAGQVTASQKPGEIYDLPAKRRWLHSDPGSVARAGQKTHSFLTGLTNQFFAQRREQILRSFGGLPAVESDLKKAEKQIDQALQMAIELYQKYDKEYEASYPDELEREKVIIKKVQEALSKHESISHVGIEEVISKAKTLIAAGKTTEDDLKIKEAMDKWMAEFLSIPPDKPINITAWNEMTHKAVPTATAITPSELPPHPHGIAQVIAHIYMNRPKLVLDALKQWGGKAYEKILDAHGYEKNKAQEAWQEELAHWDEKFATEFKYQTPTKIQQQSATTPQAPAVAAKSVGQTLSDLFSWAGKFESLEDMLRVGNALLAKKDELMAKKGSAEQLNHAINAMLQRRKFVQGNSTPAEYKMLGDLRSLVYELQTAHE